jgi:eukaryotic-like serine/threonine-protein kinase
MQQSATGYEPGELVPGTVYSVVRCIGGGGMGTVYEVEDTSIGKRYVLKTLHPHLCTREDLARRMQNEARTLARLNHPNIVEVITAGVTADEPRRPYYVMERLNGQPLRHVLQKRWQLELTHAYHIAIDLLDALEHAHDKGVIHRDVKPDNIFLHRTAAGVTITKLLDFGIMSLLDASGSETAGRFLGTLRYAAPEQLRGERPTPKMDLYAAGLVIYEMIAGRGPFDDERDPHRVAAAHLHRMPTPLSRYVQVPKELDTLLFAVLAKDPDARPRDAFALAASLRNLKNALGTAADSSRSKRAAPQKATLPASVSPLATDVGMAPPTVGMAVGKHDAITPQEGNPALDRNALTGTLAPETPLMARHGTESFAAPLPPAVYPAMLEPTPPPVAFPTPVSPILVVHAGTVQLSPVAPQPAGRSPSPVLRKSAIVAMVTSIAVSAFLASIAIVVVARHQTELKREPEPAASAATLAASSPVAAGQTQLQASGSPDGFPAGVDGGL